MDESVSRLVAVMEDQLKAFAQSMAAQQREADRRFSSIEKRMRVMGAALAGAFKKYG